MCSHGGTKWAFMHWWISLWQSMYDREWGPSGANQWRVIWTGIATLEKLLKLLLVFSLTNVTKLNIFVLSKLHIKCKLCRKKWVNSTHFYPACVFFGKIRKMYYKIFFCWFCLFVIFLSRLKIWFGYLHICMSGMSRSGLPGPGHFLLRSWYGIRNRNF